MRKLAFKAGRRGRKVEAMDEPNDRRASRGMSVVRPIAFAVVRFRIVSYRVGSTIRLQQGSRAGRNGSRAVCTARNLSRLMNNYDARLARFQISPRCPRHLCRLRLSAAVALKRIDDLTLAQKMPLAFANMAFNLRKMG